MLELPVLHLVVCVSVAYDVYEITCNAGGNSFFAPRYGFVCDNVKNYEVQYVLDLLDRVNAYGV